MRIKETLCTVLFFSVFSVNAAPCGAVLYKDGSSKHYSYYKVPDNATHHYFGFLEGPTWENKYSAFRIYVDADDRNGLDIIGKYKPEAILHHFDDPKVDEHANWPWGTDIFKAGSSMGFGSFRLLHDNQWLNPQIGKAHKNLDSLTIHILDSSTGTPKAAITYHGWDIGASNKVTVTWMVSTALNDRVTKCEVAIVGKYTGKVVVGIKKNTGVSVIQDPSKAILATIGKQGGINEGFTDTLLLAAFADKKYYSSFEQNTLNYGMALTPDSDNKVVWSLAFSWAKETDPIFRKSNWQDILFQATGINGSQNLNLSDARRSNCSTTELFSLTGRKINADVVSANKQCGVFLLRTDGMVRTSIIGANKR